MFSISWLVIYGYRISPLRALFPEIFAKKSKLTGANLSSVCFVASSSVVPIPGTFSWPLAARGKPRRGMLRRAVFSDVQRKALEKMFQKQKYISKPDRKKLASKLGLKDSQVKKKCLNAYKGLKM